MPFVFLAAKYEAGGIRFSCETGKYKNDAKRMRIEQRRLRNLLGLLILNGLINTVMQSDLRGFLRR